MADYYGKQIDRNRHVSRGVHITRGVNVSRGKPDEPIVKLDFSNPNNSQYLTLIT